MVNIDQIWNMSVCVHFYSARVGLVETAKGCDSNGVKSNLNLHYIENILIKSYFAITSNIELSIFNDSCTVLKSVIVHSLHCSWKGPKNGEI